MVARCVRDAEVPGSNPGSPTTTARVVAQYRPPSSSGLGHHPFKVAARVRIPLGVRRNLFENRVITRVFTYPRMTTRDRECPLLYANKRPLAPTKRPKYAPFCALENVSIDSNVYTSTSADSRSIFVNSSGCERLFEALKLCRTGVELRRRRAAHSRQFLYVIRPSEPVIQR